MSEPRPIPRILQLRIDRVSKGAFAETEKMFKEERQSITSELREWGMPDLKIAKLIGVSVQYLAREFPKPKKEAKS